jgi:hypothetical protein
MTLIARSVSALRRAPPSVAIIAILLWAVINVHAGLRGGFTHDDLMNLAKALSADKSQHLLEAVVPVGASTVFRPAGALLYRLVFDLAGFSPLAFHLIRLALLLAVVALVWRFTLRLTGNPAVAGMVALVLSFHTHFWALYASFGYIYDIMSAVFYFSGLCLLLPRPDSSGGRSLIILIAILVCAALSMTSKECGLTFPAAAAALLWVQWREHSVASQRLSLTAIAGSGMLAASVLYFRVLGASGLSSVGAYRPQFDAATAASNAARYVSEFLYDRFHPPLWGIGVTLIILSALFVARRSRLGGAAIVLSIVSFLPLAFIDFRGLSAVLFSAFWLALALTLAADLLVCPRFGFLAYSVPLVVVVLAAQLLTPRMTLPAYAEDSKGILAVSNQLAPVARKLRDGDLVAIVRDDYSATYPWATTFLLRIHGGPKNLIMFRPEDLIRPAETGNHDPIRLCLALSGTSVESIHFPDPDRPPASQFFVSRPPASPRSCAQILGIH